MSGGAYILGKLCLEFLQECSRAPSLEQYTAGVQPLLGQGDPAGLPSRRHSSDRIVPALPLGTGAPSPRLVWHLRHRARACAGSVAEDVFARSARPISSLPGQVIVFRFCIVYGRHQHPDDTIPRGECRPSGRVRVAVLLCRPALVHLSRRYDLRGLRSAWILLLHLLTCWLAWFGFRQQQRPVTCSPVWPYWP